MKVFVMLYGAIRVPDRLGCSYLLSVSKETVQFRVTRGGMMSGEVIPKADLCRSFS
jgi:hypothetical protein